jgi:hypothetical protein
MTFRQKPSDDATAVLLVEQARALVQGERERFTALQSQAIALLAVIGVVATVGAAFLAVFVGRRYEWVVHPWGFKLSLALVFSLVVGLVALTELFRSALRMIGALRVEPDPESGELEPIIRQQFPEMLKGGVSKSAQVVLGLLTNQLSRVQLANKAIGRNLRKAVALLASAVLSGLLLAAILLAGTETKDQTYLIEKAGKSELTVARGR